MKKIFKKLVSVVLTVSLIAGITIISSAAPATEETKTNLIQASNFYKGNKAWQIFTNSSGEETAKYVEEVVPTIGKTGALQITQIADDTDKNNAVIAQNVCLTKGNTYKLSYWMKIEGSGSSFAAYYNPVGAGLYRTELVSQVATTNGEWQKFEYTFNVDFVTNVADEEYIRFEMSDATSTEDVVFTITDVQLEETTKNYVPNYQTHQTSAWQLNENGHTVDLINNGMIVTVKANDDLTDEWTKGSTALPTFTHELKTETEYVISFNLSVEGDIENVVRYNTLESTENIFDLYSLSWDFHARIDSVDNTQSFEFAYTTPSSFSNSRMRFCFARPSEAGKTITYTITNLSITEKADVEENEDEIKELVTAQPDAVTTNSNTDNLYTNGQFVLNTDKVQYGDENFTMTEGFSDGKLSWPNGNAVNDLTWSVVQDSAVERNVFKVGSKTGANDYFLSQTIDWEAGKTYIVSYWVKTGDTAIALFYPMVAGYAPSGIGIAGGVVSDWVQHTFEFTPDESQANNDRMYFAYSLHSKDQVVYIADVQVKEKGAQPEVGEVSVSHDGAANGTYTVSFKLDIEGDGTASTSWSDGTNTFFTDENRGVLYQTGFSGNAILTTFGATAEEEFCFEYTPAADSATAGKFILYLAPTTAGELTYIISDFSVTYREGTAIKEIEVSGVDIVSAEPGEVSSWGTNDNEEAYGLVQRWERVNYGTFATDSEELNDALSAGLFTEFAAGEYYRYSLVLTPNEGYYLADDVVLKLNGAEVDADYYYDDEVLIIYPTDSEVFFTVMGDANKDGSANIKDLVRMKKHISDSQNEVYTRKCDFDKNSKIEDSDVKALRELLVK